MDLRVLRTREKGRRRVVRTRYRRNRHVGF